MSKLNIVLAALIYITVVAPATAQPTPFVIMGTSLTQTAIHATIRRFR